MRDAAILWARRGGPYRGSQAYRDGSLVMCHRLWDGSGAAQQLVKDMDDTQVGVAGDSSEEECSTDESAASSLDASRAALASVAVFAVLCSAPAFVVAVGCSVEVTGGSRHLAKADVARLTGCGWVQAEKSVEGTWCLAVVAGWATIARALRAFMCFIPMLRCWRHRQEPRAVYQYWAT